MYHFYSVAYRLPIIGGLGKIFCLYPQTLSLMGEAGIDVCSRFNTRFAAATKQNDVRSSACHASLRLARPLAALRALLPPLTANATTIAVIVTMR